MPCKSNSCKVRKDLNDDGYCPKCAAQRHNVANADDVAYPCGKCDQDCTDQAPSMQCEFCDKWYHIICIDMSSECYKVAKKVPGFMWFCNSCKNKAMESVQKAVSLEAQTNVLKNEVTDIKKRLETVETKLSGSVNKEIEQAISEKQDIERRKLNLIVYNMPEQEKSDESVWDTPAKIAADIKYVSKMVEDEFHLNMNTSTPTPKIVDARRIGKILESEPGKTPRPRPLILKFNDIESKRGVLSKAKDLRSSTDKEYKAIFINPDLTPLQRKNDAKLREEMWKRRIENNENVVIRKGKIVVVDFDVPKTRQNRAKSVTKKQGKADVGAATASTST